MPENRRPGERTSPASSDTLYDQAQGAVRDAAETASEAWDDAYEMGERYYRQGRRAIREAEMGSVGTLIVAGAIGYALAWMIHGPHAYSRYIIGGTDDVAEGMSEASDQGSRRRRAGARRRS